MFDRFRRGSLHLARIEAFSDGVFAIVVTLLVLDLKVPELDAHGSVGELAEKLVGLLPNFLSWLISFIIVCKFWLNHHYIFSLPHRADYALAWLNALFLMGQAFIPFPTALMGAYPGNPLAVTFFGGTMALNTLLFIAVYAYILGNLIEPELRATQVPHIILRSFVGVASYLVGAAAAWLNVDAAFIVYLLTPLFFITPLHRKASAG